MWIPGFGTDELRPYKRAPVTEAHKQRMALIRKQMKKFWYRLSIASNFSNELKLNNTNLIKNMDQAIDY